MKSWLLTKDHKRIALLYLGSITFFFFIGGLYAMLIRLELLTPQGDFFVDNLQQGLYAARHHHGVFLPDTIDTGNARQLPGAHDDWREGSRFPADQSAELVHLYAGRRRHYLRVARWRSRHWLDLLHALQHDVFQLLCGSHRTGNLYQRFFVDSDRPELHRYDSYDARARHDLVPSAAVYLVTLRDQPDHDSGHARHCDHDSAAGLRATGAYRHL